MKALTTSFFNLFALIAFLTSLLSSCSIVGGIFKTGYWVGIITVVAVLGIILYLVLRVSNSGSAHKS